jgi:8-oxo-dGTP pyrophosphatase MutT (NUDIX family)
MRWTVHDERTVYENPWLAVNLADVELPDGRHLDHYLLRQRPVVAAAMLDEADRILMLWRHRFIPDAWGWELPAGMVDADETLVSCAAREAEEETGWRPVNFRLLMSLRPGSGLSDCVHHVFWTNQACRIGEAADSFESDRIDWLPLKEVPDLVDRGEIQEASTVAALLRLYVTHVGHGSE